jgi:hypothetical protein
MRVAVKASSSCGCGDTGGACLAIEGDAPKFIVAIFHSDLVLSMLAALQCQDVEEFALGAKYQILGWRQQYFAQQNHLPFSELLIEVNMLLRLVPRPFTATMIAIECRRALFLQNRREFNGRHFLMFKFRTLTVQEAVVSVFGSAFFRDLAVSGMISSGPYVKAVTPIYCRKKRCGSRLRRFQYQAPLALVFFITSNDTERNNREGLGGFDLIAWPRSSPQAKSNSPVPGHSGR